ncbi:unnamed protein product [Brassica rapa subsp. trilocularis]
MCENSLIHIQQKLKSLNRLLIKSSVISYPSSVEFTYLIDQKKIKKRDKTGTICNVNRSRTNEK